jgi:Fic family protein
MKPYRAKSLPLRSLDWEKFVDLLGPAHAALARFDLITQPVERIESGAKGQLSTKLLCEMHRALKKGSDGHFRKKQNWIGPEGCLKEEAYFFPPRFETVPKSMENLRRYANAKEKDPLVQLAIYFAQLLIIHPFMDGNGRIARATIPLFLYQKKLTSTPRFSLSAYFHRHRLKYFECLYLISVHNDWEGWVRFFLQGVIDESKQVIRQSHSFSFSS